MNLTNEEKYSIGYFSFMGILSIIALIAFGILCMLGFIN